MRLPGGRLLAFPRAQWLACALAFVLGAPALAVGFHADDYMQLWALERSWPVAARAPFDLYVFSRGGADALRAMEHGPMPWWVPTGTRTAFFRPLSSALIAADFAAFGRHALGHHLHSLLWYVALIAVVGLLYRRVLPTASGALALLLYSVDAAHWLPTAYPAARHGLISATFAVLALLAHIRWRREGWRAGLAWSVLALAAGLAAGETALGMLPFLCAFEWRGARGGRARARGLAPALVLTAGYLLVYRAGRYGVSGSGSYLDPLHEPRAWLLAAPGRLVVLAGACVHKVTSDLWTLVPWTRPWLVALGIVALAILAWLLRWIAPVLPPATREALGWLLPGAAGALVPACSGFLGDRLLVLAGIGATPAVAAVLIHLPAAFCARAGGAAGAGAAGARVAWYWLAFAHGVVAPVTLAASPLLILRRFSTRTEQIGREAELPRVAGTDVNVVVGPDMLVLWAADHWFREPARRPDAWRVLSMAPHAHRLVRTGPRSLTLELRGGRMLASEWERAMRGPTHPMQPGETVVLPGLRATVLSAVEGGATRVEFRYPRDLDDPRLAFVTWRAGRLRRVTLPPVGGVLELPRERGPR